jgi:hypothetical protein
MRTREDKRMVKLDFIVFAFGHILKKSTYSFFGAWSFLLVHVRLTRVTGATPTLW